MYMHVNEINSFHNSQIQNMQVKGEKKESSQQQRSNYFLEHRNPTAQAS